MVFEIFTVPKISRRRAVETSDVWPLYDTLILRQTVLIQNKLVTYISINIIIIFPVNIMIYLLVITGGFTLTHLNNNIFNSISKESRKLLLTKTFIYF